MKLTKLFSSLAMSTMLGVSTLFAASVADLQDKSYTIGSEETKTSGFYVNYNAEAKMWFLYMPALNYLLVHETGKSSTADGAQQVNVADFDSITVDESTITFGALTNMDSAAADLAGKVYVVGSEETKTSGYYVNYNATDKMWFLYMPKLNYLLVHETGKSSTADGAQQLNVADVTGGIDVTGSTVTFGSTTEPTPTPTATEEVSLTPPGVTDIPSPF